ncbi:TPA: type-F conjugative transfer system pilin assembly thiol-disulfide isomerase TrbB [Morganella morganii]|nr:type-F conjugative transfer system pilin assembly thiol-disulfide isomerase TrbB [Morganella morganii]
MKRLCILLLMVCLPAAAGTLEDIAALEAVKGQKTPGGDTVTAPAPLRRAPVPRPYALPDGRTVNLNDYTLVLFMQSECIYCRQFDPLLKQWADMRGFKVFVYSLNGQGDPSFPDAIPAPQSVVQTFFGSGIPVMTPTLFLVEVNTLKTAPLAQGLTPVKEIENRLHRTLMAAQP